MKGKAIKFGKNKYIMAAIALILVLTVGISFCLWDTTSINNLTMKVSTANFGIFMYADKIVGSVFTDGNSTDSNRTEWLVVDKEVKPDGTTEMILMTNKVTATRAYSTSATNPDYNSTSNNIRDYLNTTWYPSISGSIKQFVKERSTTYHKDEKFPWVTGGVTLAPGKMNFAWIPSTTEIGLYIRSWRGYSSVMSEKMFSHFTRSEVSLELAEDASFQRGEHASRIAYNAAGAAVEWWTRTPREVSGYVQLINGKGGSSGASKDDITNNYNWMRPCVMVKF